MNARLLLLSTAVLGAVSCGGGGDAQPPTAVATPTPAPVPSPSPAGFTCPLPALPDLHNTCPKLTPQLWEIVENAIQATIQQHPELFNFNDDLGGGAFKVLDKQGRVVDNFPRRNQHVDLSLVMVGNRWRLSNVFDLEG